MIKKNKLKKNGIYVVDGRNFDISLWDGQKFVGIRFKVFEHILCNEDHWDDGGTVKPKRLICIIDDKTDVFNCLSRVSEQMKEEK